MSSILFVDSHPTEAVSQARALVSQDREDAWEALDRHLRWHVVHWIQDRAAEVEALREALLDAWRWAERSERDPWRQRWSFLLEILRDAEQQPGIAADLEAVGGRAAEVLAILAEQSKPMRPTDLGEEMGVSIQQISNLGRKLEGAGLIVRRSSGKATWLYLTPRGARLAEILGKPAPASYSEEDSLDLAPELLPWNGSALAEPVELAKAS